MHTKEFYQNWKPPEPEHNVLTPWNWVVAYPDNLVIGKYVDIGAFTYLQAEESIVLSDHSFVGCRGRGSPVFLIQGGIVPRTFSDNYLYIESYIQYHASNNYGET